MTLRIVATIVLLISATAWPFWVTIAVGTIFLIYFPLYIEGVLVFLVYDALYAPGTTVPFPVTLGAIGLLCIMMIIRKFLFTRSI